MELQALQLILQNTQQLMNGEKVV